MKSTIKKRTWQAIYRLLDSVCPIDGSEVRENGVVLQSDMGRRLLAARSAGRSVSDRKNRADADGVGRCKALRPCRCEKDEGVAGDFGGFASCKRGVALC